MKTYSYNVGQLNEEEKKEFVLKCENEFEAQLEKASKVAKYALILGEDEIKSGKITVKNLETSEQNLVTRSCVLEYLKI